MIPYTACLGFHCGPGSTRWQGFPDHPHRRPKISLKRTDENHIHIKIEEIHPPLDSSLRHGTLTSAESALLETLDLSDHRQRTTGKFLTLNRKRRRVPLSLDAEYNSVNFEDVYHGQTKCVLRQADKWPFNAFILDAVTGGRSLPILLTHLFSQYGLIDYFDLDVVKVWKCFNLIEEGYHSNNPYHNAIHASDVSQAMHCFLQEEKIAQCITPLEIMASLIAAVSHDLDHPGVNQPFLVATSNHLAALYKNSSVLENHHWRSAVACLMESGIFDHIRKDFWDNLIWQIRSLILATDITRQQEFLSRFKRYMDTNVLDMKEMEYRHFILQIALKCADICNPCRPWIVSKIWSDRVCEEFFRQGDFERELNLPVTSLCDRFSMSKPKIQAGFFRFVVSPLFEAWDKFQQTAMSEKLVENLRKNQNEWERLADEETKNAIKNGTDTEVQHRIADDDDDDDNNDDIKEKKLHRAIYPHDSIDVSSNLLRGRRHSLPLSLPKMLPYTIIRRKSISNICTLSAEALIPDTRITSISAEAPRLAGLFSEQKGSRHLIKQMTYPPTCFQSWQEACAEILPGAICSTSLSELESESPVDQRKNSKQTSSGHLSKKLHSLSVKNLQFHHCETFEDDVENSSIKTEKERDDKEECENGCCSPTSSHPLCNGSQKMSSNGRSIPTSVHSYYENSYSVKCNKENAKPFLKNSNPRCQYSSEETSLEFIVSSTSPTQMIPQITRRRGSAPVGLQYFVDEIHASLRGNSSVVLRRGSMPNDIIPGVQQSKKSLDCLPNRRNSLPLTSLESILNESSEAISSTLDVDNQRISFPDKPFKNRLNFQFNTDSFGLRRKSLGTRNSIPLKLFDSSGIETKDTCSIVNKDVFVSSGQISAVSENSSRIELLSTLFQSSSYHSVDNLSSIETSNFFQKSNNNYSPHNLYQLKNFKICSAIKQSESFDLGILINNNESAEVIEEDEFWGVDYSRRRNSVPVNICLLPNP